MSAHLCLEHVDRDTERRAVHLRQLILGSSGHDIRRPTYAKQVSS